MEVTSPRLRQRDGGRSGRPLSPDDWARAALVAIGEGGLGAVAIEPLAARLGTTKGSFYWHFTDRQALLGMALRMWEQDRTEAVIAALEPEPDPARRLRRLFALAMEAGLADRTELTLLATAADPLVGTALRRVTARRISYIAELLEALGLRPAKARSRALVAYTGYLGHLQVAHVASDALPDTARERKRHLDEVLDTLLPKAVP